jgi:hypothetical protein
MVGWRVSIWEQTSPINRLNPSSLWVALVKAMWWFKNGNVQEALGKQSTECLRPWAGSQMLSLHRV